jgi:hypothetical protein
MSHSLDPIFGLELPFVFIPHGAALLSRFAQEVRIPAELRPGDLAPAVPLSGRERGLFPARDAQDKQGGDEAQRAAAGESKQVAP